MTRLKLGLLPDDKCCTPRYLVHLMLGSGPRRGPDMKRSKFTEEQIIAILREQEAGAKTAEVCRWQGVSGATFYAWKAKFGGMEPSEAKRLKALEDENAKLKRLLAETMLDIEPLSAIGSRTMARRAEGSAVKKMVTPAARREAVAHLERGYEMSERRACSLIGADRSSVRYRHRRPDDRELREVLRGAAETHRRFGYRRLHVLLRRDGHVLNRKRTQRLYREDRVGSENSPGDCFPDDAFGASAPKQEAHHRNTGTAGDRGSGQRPLVGRLRPRPVR